MTSDRHREKPISLRLGPDRQRLEEYARATGQPVRRVIIDAVRARLDEDGSRRQVEVIEQLVLPPPAGE